MIFYFSGTGNSLYAARQLGKKYGEDIVDMSLESNKAKEYVIKDKENVGFVFPVYFYSVNDIVSKFIESMNLKCNENTYVYAVVTCGASIGGCGSLLKQKLAKKGIILKAVYPLVMPDNAMIYYSIKSKEENEKIFESSLLELDKICAKLDEKSSTKFGGTFISKLLLFVYHRLLSTRKFKVEESCISCGECANNCPEKSIEMVDGKPVWKKDKCVKCLSCINRCPKAAIQYGHFTKKRHRYENTHISN